MPKYHIKTNKISNWTNNRQQCEANLYSTLRKESGVTLVELLVVVAIIGILGGITGLFLLKYIPEYNLRAALNTLSQDLRQTQVGALKKVNSWRMNFDATTNHTYTVIDGDGNAVKTINLKSYDSQIRFVDIKTGATATNFIIFDAEGLANQQVTIRMKNSVGTIHSLQILKTGVVRAD